MHTATDAMASCCTLLLWVFSIVIVCSSSLSVEAEDLCTNQWEVSVDGVDSSELTVHHSSTFVPGLFTHLVWHWRQRGKPSGTLWLSQAQKRGKFSGGFVAQLKSGFKIPASIQWSLYNGSLSVSSHGRAQELAKYPGWKVAVCNSLLAWGVTEDKELFITYDAVNETRSLDESWTADKRFKRQAEFPVVPEGPQKPNSTFAMWWRRFIDSIGGSYQGDKPRSWILDMTELILKLIFSTARAQGGSNSNIPRNPDAEEFPRTNRDVESVTKDGYPTLDIPKRIY